MITIDNLKIYISCIIDHLKYTYIQNLFIYFHRFPFTEKDISISPTYLQKRRITEEQNTLIMLSLSSTFKVLLSGSSPHTHQNF